MSSMEEEVDFGWWREMFVGFSQWMKRLLAADEDIFCREERYVLSINGFINGDNGECR